VVEMVAMTLFRRKIARYFDLHVGLVEIGLSDLELILLLPADPHKIVRYLFRLVQTLS
jgi:hypothetical protein